MEENKRTYTSEKDFVLYLAKGSVDPDGFISSEDGNQTLVERIADATRFTSVEANRNATEYFSSNGRYPFKLKITNYKNLSF